MEKTALSVGKSVLNGALRYAKSALAEEVALQLGVRRDCMKGRGGCRRGCPSGHNTPVAARAGQRWCGTSARVCRAWKRAHQIHGDGDGDQFLWNFQFVKLES